jgi:hypothetical protein
MKQQSRNRPTTQQESQLYDELGRLNNELVNLQRELTKKNAELEQLNSQIGVESVVGQGSTFYVKLPLPKDTRTDIANPTDKPGVFIE